MPGEANKVATETDGEAHAMRVWFRFLRLHQRVSTAMTARLKLIGLSVPQFDLLSTLTEREGITQSELAERLYVTKGNVSGLVDRLVEAGMVERQPIANDKRSYALHLTVHGRDLAQQGLSAQRNYVGGTLGKLSPADIDQLDQLVTIWRDIVRAQAKMG